MQNLLNFPTDLVNPITGKDIFQEDIGTYSSFNNILDLYVSDGNFITDTQSNFYNEVKFPNYDDLDTFATLLDKSRKSIALYYYSNGRPEIEVNSGLENHSTLFVKRSDNKNDQKDFNKTTLKSLIKLFLPPIFLQIFKK